MEFNFGNNGFYLYSMPNWHPAYLTDQNCGGYFYPIVTQTSYSPDFSNTDTTGLSSVSSNFTPPTFQPPISVNFMLPKNNVVNSNSNNTSMGLDIDNYSGFQQRRIGRKILEKWFDTHQNFPFPSKEVVLELTLETRMSKKQISNWFRYHRKKQKKAGPAKSSEDTSALTSWINEDSGTDVNLNAGLNSIQTTETSQPAPVSPDTTPTRVKRAKKVSKQKAEEQD